MQRVIFYLVVLITTTVLGQDHEKLKVREAIDTFFEGFHKGDTLLMKTVLADQLIMQTAYRTKESKDVLKNDGDLGTLLKAIAKRPADQKWDERLLDYSIQVDGNMANAWTPYEFWLNGEFSHCGVNSFQLFKDGEQWKIIYLIDTRRRERCR